MFNYNNGYSLITGASYGLGAEFARQLAFKGSNLILVARSKEKLEALSNELKQQFNIKILFIAADLTNNADIENIFKIITDECIQINLLINNAGVGTTGSFLSKDFAEYQTQMSLNNQALVNLTYKFLPNMLSKKYGGIINIGSSVSFQPIPYMAIYAATKAFVLSFSEALGYELKDTNIRVLVSCPGTTNTHFFDNIKSAITRKQMDDPKIVVKNTIKAFEDNKKIAYPGRLFVYFNSFMIRFIPRSMVVKMTGIVVKALGFNNV